MCKMLLCYVTQVLYKIHLLCVYKLNTITNTLFWLYVLIHVNNIYSKCCNRNKTLLLGNTWNGHPIQLPESVTMLSTTLSSKILLWDNSEFHAR